MPEMTVEQLREEIWATYLPGIALDNGHDEFKKVYVEIIERLVLEGRAEVAKLREERICPREKCDNWKKGKGKIIYECYAKINCPRVYSHLPDQFKPKE